LQAEEAEDATEEAFDAGALAQLFQPLHRLLAAARQRRLG